VFCATESSPEKGETVIQGRHILEQIIVADDGNIANRNLELAYTLGMTQNGTSFSPDFLAGPAEEDELIRWVEAAAKIAQQVNPVDVSPRVPNIQTRAGFFQYATEAFSDAEIRRRISPRDVDYYIGNLKDGAAVPEPARLAWTYLIQSGLWLPQADNTLRPNEPMRRSDALSILTRWIEASRPEILRKGTFVSAGSLRDEAGAASSINVKWGNKTQELPLANDRFCSGWIWAG
jgi:hypothetical protein